ncbi:MAG: DUF3488 and transglutaminase-like domain-containing protein, partial [gamma proteobacterium symbiont of Bathyaustriella thionipta]|nr:DUF3488 and transglutaminase-like domain-containing protein [gamma proteobacterium symbiont of Bathyaustriella thionipta]
MKALQKPVDLSRSQLLSILFLICAAAVAHVSRISIEVSLFAGALVLLRLIRLHKTQQLPGRFLISLLTFTAVVVVIYSQPRLASLSTGIAFLVILSALKLWELRQRLDLYLLSFLGYYLVITQFLFNQELWFGALMFAIALGLTAFLYSIHFVRTPGWRQTLRPAFILLLQAMPLAVMMFLLFPRFASPLWSIGLESDFASTGLSTEVSPGSIGQLSRSHAIAFRVKFDDEIPPPNKRYWRAAVFRDTDGFTWHYQPSPLLARLPRVLEAWSHPLGYEIEIEPAPNDWLFALDIPAVIPEHAHLSRAFELVSDKPINKINRYHLSSFTDYALLDLTPAERQRALALPDTITRRMRQLVSQWQAKAATPAEVVHAALDYYRTQPFYYTLTPPLMAGSNPDDEFLFEARQGFCGHYASSFILLMRIAGIPARMVTGYQGGEMNPLGDYMIVRQSSAHAWAEVYLADRGWTRVDPTAAVAPERILQAI